MSRRSVFAVLFTATMSISRGVAAAVCLCYFAILLSAHAQTIEVPCQTKAAPPTPAKRASNSPRAQTARVSHAPAIPTPIAPELVDVQSVDPTIVVDLRYATPHNVTGRALYPAGMRAQI